MSTSENNEKKGHVCKNDMCAAMHKSGNGMIIVVVVIAALVGVWYFANGSDSSDAMKKDAMKTSVSPASVTDTKMSNGTMKDDTMADAKTMDKKMADATDTKTVGGATNTGEKMADDKMTEKAGMYEVYDPAKIAQAKTGKVVLFFRASWCPSCKALDKDIREHLKDIPEDLTILDVDYDKYTDLKKKYGVVMQHTLVQVDADGNELQKWTGVPTLADLANELKK